MGNTKEQKKFKLKKNLQNDNGTIINVLIPNDLKDTHIDKSENISTQSWRFLIEKNLEPIAPCLTTYIKDDLHFITPKNHKLWKNIIFM